MDRIRKWLVRRYLKKYLVRVWNELHDLADIHGRLFTRELEFGYRYDIDKYKDVPQHVKDQAKRSADIRANYHFGKSHAYRSAAKMVLDVEREQGV